MCKCANGRLRDAIKTFFNHLHICTFSHLHINKAFSHSHIPTFPSMERHPLQPFLPPNAHILMLGSFPPPRKRWSIDFFYPNMQNDMWRIFGLIYFNDKDHFIDVPNKRFDKPKLKAFLTMRGIALYDTACAVNRLQDNASDKFLEVVEHTDIDHLLRQLPQCHAIVTTGQKATDTLRAHFSVAEPKVGEYTTFNFEGRPMRLYRMPSSSRAYPLNILKKAAVYQQMLQQEQLL